MTRQVSFLVIHYEEGHQKIPENASKFFEAKGHVTAGHETGGLAGIGHSKNSTDYIGIDLGLMQKTTITLERIAAEPGKNPSPEKIQDVVKRLLGVEITAQEAKVVADGTILKLDPKNYSYPTLHTLAFVLRPYYRVAWAGKTHTATPLWAFGSGPGSEKLTGFHHNTELISIMNSAWETDWFSFYRGSKTCFRGCAVGVR